MNPEITVVVPYYNEKATIEYTLKRVGEQTLPAKYAIFVNSSSSDNTFDVVDSWIRKNQHRFSTIFLNVFENSSNPGSSKNVGIRHTKTKWVAFMDCGQSFETDWLEKQFKFAVENKLSVVSGVVNLVGENWVDRCAVAQTYGYKRDRPCLPTTLVKRSVFDNTGVFLTGRRAGYDVAWPIKLKKLGIKRGINTGIKIVYIGTNYSSNISHLFKKSIMYAKPTVAIEGYIFPYLYLAAFLLFIISAAFTFKLTVAMMVFYIVSRSFVVPIIKSRNIDIYVEHPLESLLGLALVGFIIDSGKILGIILGIKCYLLKSGSPLQN